MKYYYLLAFILIASVACNKKKEDNASVEPKRNVTLRISCSDCFVVWHENGVEKNEQHANSSWTRTFVGNKGTEVLLAAMNTSGTPQAVAAAIVLNNDTLKHQINFCPISGTVIVVDTLQ
jgi:hypothetical protein